MELIEPPEQVISAQLGSGERLLWAGRPRQGIFLRPADAYTIPFSLMWGGFAMFWEYMAFNSKAPFFFRLWGVPFVAIGLYLMIGRFFVEARQRSKTYYGLSNSRVIIVSGLVERSVKSLQLRGLDEISLSERADGSGTVTLGPAPPPRWSGPAGWPGSNRYAPPILDSIPSARDVYNRIRAAQSEA